jgi:hypothetical protein
MSGLPGTSIPDRHILVAAAGELAEVLRSEVGRLDRDAKALELRGNRLFAGQVRDIRTRFAKVLQAADAVIGHRGAAA